MTRQNRASRRRGPSRAPAKPQSSAAPKGERAAVFQKEFREDLEHWIKTDYKTALRVLRIVEEIIRDPFHGIAKPEPLTAVLPDTWSRRLTDVDRIVYLVSDDRIEFLQARYHY